MLPDIISYAGRLHTGSLLPRGNINRAAVHGVQDVDIPLALWEHLSLGVANTLHWCFAIVGSMLMKNTTHSYHTHTFSNAYSTMWQPFDTVTGSVVLSDMNVRTNMNILKCHI